MPEASKTWMITFVRSIWRKKSWPRPTPSEAPSIRPGISAMTKFWASPRLTTPKTGVIVVKW